jgi:antitoxin CptB
LIDPLQGRLAWRCRRGMKELDLLLARYLRNRWPAASQPERALFEQFLELPDPELASYLIGGETPMDPALVALVSAMRALPAT